MADVKKAPQVETNNNTVLIVEDSPTQSEKLRYVLESGGYRVTAAANGAEALEILKNLIPSIIISDVVMPIMDGYQLCLRIKALEGLRYVPVILLTSLSESRDIFKGLECGADHFITKPYNDEYLLSHVRGVLTNWQLHDQDNNRQVLKAVVGGQKYTIKADRPHIFNLLISAYEAALQQRTELEEMQAALTILNENLETTVSQRTESLRKEIEERKKTEQLLQEMFNSSTVGMYIAQDGKFRVVNPRFQKLTGYREAELLGKDPLSIVTPSDRTMARDSAVHMLKGKTDSPYEFRYITRSGDTKWALASVANVTFMNERATLGSFLDNTQIKEREAQILVNSKLVSIGELAAGVAHEINNPLTSVIGYAQLLAENPNVPQDIKEDLGKIYQESQRAVKIVQNLLRFARQQKTEKSPADVNDLIARTVEMKSYQFRSKNIQIDTKLAPNLPYIPVDINQMQQVILNIIINAQQAITEVKHEGRIEVTTSRDDNYVLISVTDDGPGIAPENINKLLDPFFTTKPESTGTGLGLSICHGIVKEHGGDLIVESTPGKGARFTIRLPIPAAAGNMPETTVKETPVTKPRRRRPETGAASLLIVDDEPSILEVVRRILSKKGYRVQTALSGEAALAELAKNAYDLCLTDLRMSAMDGKELYARIKKEHPGMSQKIVFLTGDTVSAETHQFLESTGRPHLNKPFDYEKLVEVVEQALGEGSQ